jgi:hypothetical protein
VIVPEGVGVGQTIAVMAPDGSRLVRATIPPGLKCGDTFLVRLSKAIHPDVLRSQPMQPPGVGGQPVFANALEDWTTPIDQKLPERATEKAAIVDNVHVIENAFNPKSKPTFVNALDRWLTPIPDDVRQNHDNNSITETFQERDAPPVTSPKIENQPQIPIQDELASTPPASATPYHAPSETQQVPISPKHDFSPSPPAPPSPAQAPRISGQLVNAHIEKAEPQLDAATSSPKSSQKLLLVHVPPGMPAGSIMQVEIPGEDRTVSAQIPQGAQSFHIAYTPRFSATSSQSSFKAMPPPPLQAPSTVVSKQKNRAQSPKGHKLLLVRVPPGTEAGTTLHVSVPDEPGRILAAQVPPGNVQEFHVSYEARPKKSSGRDGAGMLPPANPYYSQPHQYNYDPNYQQQPAQQPSYYHPNGPNQYHPPQQPRMMANNSENNPSGGYWFPSMVGATAMGAAGAAAYEHFQHPQNENQNQYSEYNRTNNNEYDNGGDMIGDSGGDYELTDF